MGDNSGEGPDSTGPRDKRFKGAVRQRSRAPRDTTRKIGGAIDHPIAPEVKAEAKRLYFDYVPRREICERTGVLLETLKYWIKKGKWLEMREGLNLELSKEINRRRAFTWGKIVNQSAEIIARYVADVAARDHVEAKDAYFASQIVGQLDKAMRLAQGEPTDVVEHKGTVGMAAIAFKTEREIRAALKGDPMTDIKGTLPFDRRGEKELDQLEADSQAVVLAEIKKGEVT